MGDKVSYGKLSDTCFVTTLGMPLFVYAFASVRARGLDTCQSEPLPPSGQAKGRPQRNNADSPSYFEFTTATDFA